MDASAQPFESGESSSAGVARRAQRLLEADAEANFDKAFELYIERLRSFCRSLVPPCDVGDLFQETYLRGKRNITQLRNKRSLFAWLKAIARHQSIWMGEQRRRQAPQDQTSIDPNPLTTTADGRDCFEEATTAEDVRAVLNEIAETHPELSEALVLQTLGFSYREIADKQRIPINSVGPRLTKAKTEFERRYRGGDQHD